VSARAAIVTISTSKARGEGEDTARPRLRALAERAGAEVVAEELVTDDRALIERTLIFLCDEQRCDLVLTSGGTGVSPSDVTPEATATVTDRWVPGIPEAIRSASREHTKHWMLSRAAAGIRGKALVINLPGNPKAIAEAGEATADALPHALDLLAGRPTQH
jgi:molybdenum cofactor synthesis domain-containing protein